MQLRLRLLTALLRSLFLKFPPNRTKKCVFEPLFCTIDIKRGVDHDG
ncbi:hypothetical protein HMPREF9104_00167 [Lentilactobacillus kisonensis F0435]|uniref:Uncharacterized protein n=1 Tax=Lentilactobacillus kisonensis F0435 TaxID=797516 RepID=H1LC54_9LACO|nr:hypothetical protein HMPREF9104_00167 [Lentilactobacillus kisonensis F0435]